MKSIRVAVIDDGINEKAFNIFLENNLLIDISGKLHKREYNSSYLLSHGTICAAIIKKYYSRASISSLKILNGEHKKGTIDSLLVALEWCKENGINVINMSLGSVDFRDRECLRDKINELTNLGIIIVSASSNRNYVTYPACLANTISVQHSNSLSCGEYLYHVGTVKNIEIETSSRHHLLKSTGEVYICESANSYAAPFITAKVCAIMSEFNGHAIEYVKQLLLRNSINASDYSNSILNYYRPDWIKNAVLISDSDKYNLQGYKLYFNICKEYVFENIDKLQHEYCIQRELEQVKFDTFIIHFNNSSECLMILKLCKHFEKNIVILNSGFKEIPFKSYYRKVWLPEIWKPQLLDLPGSNIEIPSVIINDTVNIRLFEIMDFLKANFKENSYNALLCSNDEISVLCDYFYTPLIDRDAIKYIYQLSYFYQADIVIIGNCNNDSCDRIFHNSDYIFDIEIRIEDNENCLLNYIINETENVYERIESNTLYKKIISLL